MKIEKVQGLEKHLKCERTEHREKEEIVLHEHTEEHVFDRHLFLGYCSYYIQVTGKVTVQL